MSGSSDRVLDVLGLLRPERAALVDVLSSLDTDGWSTPTECPAWTVEGVARHLLGDDLSLLSRQRDSRTSGLLSYAEDHPGIGFRELLDGFNEQWVTASRFLSNALVVELLGLCGSWSAEFYESIDPHRLGEPVGLFGAQDASPYWQIVAREYLERWAHHHQIRRAVGAPDLDGEYLRAAADVVLTSLAPAMTRVEGEPGEQIQVEVSPLGSWTFERGAHEWSVRPAAPEDPAATTGLHLLLDQPRATIVLSRGLDGAEVWEAFAVTGDERLAAAMRDLLVSILGRP